MKEDPHSLAELVAELKDYVSILLPLIAPDEPELVDQQGFSDAFAALRFENHALSAGDFERVTNENDLDDELAMIFEMDIQPELGAKPPLEIIQGIVDRWSEMLFAAALIDPTIGNRSRPSGLTS